MIGNRDGKFMDRLIPSLLGGAVAVVGMALVFLLDLRLSGVSKDKS